MQTPSRGTLKRQFSADAMQMQKFDYYFVDLTLGAAMHSKCIAVYGENPTYACISIPNSTCKVATCEV